jgi:hypothetical protein
LPTPEPFQALAASTDGSMAALPRSAPRSAAPIVAAVVVLAVLSVVAVVLVSGGDPSPAPAAVPTLAVW